jgi:lipid-binding SYLF domain-containing protein
VTAAGFGFTLGYAEVDSVTVLDTPEAVHSFKKTVVELDSDVTGAAFSAAAHLPATAANLSHLALSDKEFTYSIASGVMVDVSLTGLVFSVDAARNKSAYGAFASPAAVLEGGVRPPGAMAELYAALDRAMQAHDVEEGGEGAGAGAGAAELAHAHGE